MKVVLIVIALSLILSCKCADISSENLSNVINSRLRDHTIDLPEEFLKELRLEIEDPRRGSGGITAVVNDFADEVLGNIRKLILNNSLDPMELPETTLKLIPTGSITLSSGWLQDTSTLSRNGNVTVTYGSDTQTITFNVPIKFDSLLFKYQYLTKIILLSIKGEAYGKVENLKINVKLSFNYNTTQASLDSFNIANTGKFSLKFTGNGLVDWITNIMTSIVTTFLHPVIVQIIQGIVKGGLQAAVDAVNSFIDSILHPATTLANSLM